MPPAPSLAVYPRPKQSLVEFGDRSPRRRCLDILGIKSQYLRFLLGSKRLARNFPQIAPASAGGRLGFALNGGMCFLVSLCYAYRVHAADTTGCPISHPSELLASICRRLDRVPWFPWRERERERERASLGSMWCWCSSSIWCEELSIRCLKALEPTEFLPLGRSIRPHM
jgi:hypothetical protein